MHLMAGHRRSSQADTAARRLGAVIAHVATIGVERTHAADRTTRPHHFVGAHPAPLCGLQADGRERERESEPLSPLASMAIARDSPTAAAPEPPHCLLLGSPVSSAAGTGTGAGMDTGTARGLLAGPPVIIGGAVLDVNASPLASEAAGVAAAATTHPGKVSFTPGGVARNMAAAMAALNCAPLFISVLGDDHPGRMLLSHCASLGLPPRGLSIIPSASTPVVCSLFSAQGDLMRGVADVSTVESHLSPPLISSYSPDIHRAPLLILDANLTPAALQHACELATLSSVPVWANAVSVPKSLRLLPVLGQLHLLALNVLELQAMAKALAKQGISTVQSAGPRGRECGDAERDSGACSWGKREGEGEDCREAAGTRQHPHTPPVWQPQQSLVEQVLLAGVHTVLLTMGHNGAILATIDAAMCPAIATHTIVGPPPHTPPTPSLKPGVTSLCNESKACIQTWRFKAMHRGLSVSKHEGPLNYTLTHYPALPLRVPLGRRNVNGAGDCLMAATAAAACMGVAMARAVALGMEAARVTVESGETVPSNSLQEHVRPLLV